MVDENVNTTKKVVENKSGKSIFPRMTLSKVLPLVKAIYELGEGDSVPRLIVFDKLGKSPESGPSRMLVSTSNAYGLTTGSYQAERLGITERGKAIVTSEDPVKTQGYAVQILLSNNIFKTFYEKLVNKSVPTEPMGIDYLKQAGLNDSDAKTAYGVFIENLKTYGFTKELSGNLRVIPMTMMEAKIPDHSNTKEKTGREPGIPSGTPPEQIKGDEAKQKSPTLSSVLTPQFNFNIQIEIPDNASKETYDNIFKSIAENLLKQYDK